MFTKFAKLEVLDVKSAPSRVRSASLSKFADFNEYRTDDGYVYVRVRAISSRVNKNHDGWPSAELQKAYRSFIGKPIFVDHHNTDPKKARGVIVDAAIHVEDAKTSALDPYYASAPAEHLPPTWIELLLEVDAKRFPKLAKAVVNGEIDGVSMGCNVEMSKCSHCGNEARSPEQYCKHVQSKGAYFDIVLPDGTKTSKRAYEDCYDIGFFEISFVFDPADETALVSDIKTSKIAAIHAEADTRVANKYIEQRGDKWVITQKGTGKVLSEHDSEEKAESAFRAMEMHKHEGARTADRNPPPQAEMTTAPDKVDTLRQEQVCPICGSDMEDGVCEVCNYEEPPEGFDNPDLSKAKEVDQQMRQQDEQQAAQGLDDQTPNDVTPAPGNGPAPMPGGATPTAAPVTSKTKWSAPVKVENQKFASTNGGRINTQERPILPVTRQLSDKPLNTKTVAQATKAVESNTKENMTTTTQKTADGTKPLDSQAQPEKRVDVIGVGGVDPVENAKSVDVTGVGAVSGDPLSGIEHENVEKDTGDFTAPHTDTWSNGEGDSLGQHDPVTDDKGDFFTVSSERTAADAEDNAGEDAGSTGGAKAGGPTWDTSDAGFPDHQPARVDVAAPLKEEVGEGTKTFPKDDMHVGDPVTSESANEIGGPVGTAIAKAKALQMKAFKVAETEIELGITDADKKFERVAELEDHSEDALDALSATLARVKTAGLAKKTASTPKTAGVGRMPSFSKTAAFDIEAHSVSDSTVEDVIGW